MNEYYSNIYPYPHAQCKSVAKRKMYTDNVGYFTSELEIQEGTEALVLHCLCSCNL